MKEYKIYIFDFDGTICDTIESLYKVFRDCFAAVGIYGITNEECEEFTHHTLKQTAEMKGVPEASFQTFFDACIASLDLPETIEKSKAFPESVKVLKFLENHRKTLAVCSGNTTRHIQDVIAYLRWDIHFSNYMGSDIYRHGKPSAEPLLFCLRDLGEEPSLDVVYIGDSMQDMEAAKAAGIDGVLIDRKNEHPDYSGMRITSLEELLGW